MIEPEPLISVALCTYNGGKFLRKQLDSVLSQSYSNLEIVVGDDQSTDDTRQILTEYVQRDSRIRVFVNEKNIGYTRNFEQTLKRCKADYLAICDQDDIWHKDKLRLQMAKLGDHALVYHDSELVDEYGTSMNFKISNKFNFYSGSRAETFLFLNCISGHSVLMRKSVLASALPFPEGFHYDQWLAFVATSIGSIDFVDQCLVQYRQHQKNSTDLLALKKIKVGREEKIKRLWAESEWLKTCSVRFPHLKNTFLDELYVKSIQRNVSFFSPAFFGLVWRNREALLFLLKKNSLSKFFYTLRKSWGQSSRRYA
jgi:glycosyltransferase involved in cell wall biosynthesis